MKITINQAALAKAATDIREIIENRNVIPVLANIAISAKDGRATLKASNLEQEAVVSIPCEGDAEFTLDGDKLASMAKASPKGKDIAFSVKDGRVDVSAGRSKWKVATLPIEDFPNLREVKPECEFEIDAPELVAALARCAKCMSEAEAKYYLQGVFLHYFEGAIHIASTDGSAMATLPLINGEFGSLPDVIVPSNNVKQLIKLLAGFVGTVNVGVSANYVAWAWGDMALTTKTIDGTFPDYRRVIPADASTSVTIDCGELAGAVKRVTLLLDEKTKAITMKFGKDEVELVAVSMTGEQANEAVLCAIVGNGMSAKMNAAFLLNQVDNCGQSITLGMRGPVDPVRIGGDVEGYIGVIMPMRG